VEKPQINRILIVRTDRIGDVILTLPMISALHSSFPSASLAILLRSYTEDLAEGQEGLSSVITEDVQEKKKSFFSLLAELRTERFDAVVVAYPRFRIALLLRLAGIPLRVGTAFRWYSFLFNRKVYEHRKTVEKHEAEYNLSLLKELGCGIPEKAEAHLAITKKDKEKAASIRAELGLKDSDRIVLLHPGSGGSARNWKPENFASLAREIARKRFRVFITGTEAEKDLVQRVVLLSQGTAHRFISNLTLREFGAFIQTASAFVANSTGPLHIAAAVGTPVVGFYPPIKVMSAKRWGPLSDKKIIFTPDPALCSICGGGECSGSICMDQITVEQAAEAVFQLTGETAG
jgi:lipopolysaccharide heptosyltransferase II